MSNNNIPASKDLRKLASDLRAEAKKIKDVKLIKCAKLVVGLTALAQLQRKVRSL